MRPARRQPARSESHWARVTSHRPSTLRATASANVGRGPPPAGRRRRRRWRGPLRDPALVDRGRRQRRPAPAHVPRVVGFAWITAPSDQSHQGIQGEGLQISPARHLAQGPGGRLEPGASRAALAAAPCSGAALSAALDDPAAHTARPTSSSPSPAGCVTHRHPPLAPLNDLHFDPDRRSAARCWARPPSTEYRRREESAVGARRSPHNRPSGAT